MKFAKLILSICTITFCLALIATIANAQTVNRETEATLLATTTNSINGAWQLNQNESDDVLPKIESLLASGGAPPDADAEQNALPTLSVSLFPPATLFVHIGEAGETTINENFADMVQTRTFLSDNITHTFELRRGANFSVTASHKDNCLTAETVSPRGNRMIETYEQTSTGKLLVTIRIESPAAQEIIGLRRVYDRLLIELPLAEETF